MNKTFINLTGSEVVNTNHRLQWTPWHRREMIRAAIRGRLDINVKVGQIRELIDDFGFAGNGKKVDTELARRTAGAVKYTMEKYLKYPNGPVIYSKDQWFMPRAWYPQWMRALLVSDWTSISVPHKAKGITLIDLAHYDISNVPDVSALLAPGESVVVDLGDLNGVPAVSSVSGPVSISIPVPWTMQTGQAMGICSVQHTGGVHTTIPGTPISKSKPQSTAQRSQSVPVSMPQPKAQYASIRKQQLASPVVGATNLTAQQLQTLELHIEAMNVVVNTNVRQVRNLHHYARECFQQMQESTAKMAKKEKASKARIVALEVELRQLKEMLRTRVGGECGTEEEALVRMEGGEEGGQVEVDPN